MPQTTTVSCGPVEGYPDLTTLAAAHPASPPAVDVTENDDTTILYTSGTTGRPKGALFDHHRTWVGANSAFMLGLRDGDRILHDPTPSPDATITRSPA